MKNIRKIQYGIFKKYYNATDQDEDPNVTIWQYNMIELCESDDKTRTQYYYVI